MKKYKKRTTHRSRAGRKLYALRDEKGRFEDIVKYQEAYNKERKQSAERK